MRYNGSKTEDFFNMCQLQMFGSWQLIASDAPINSSIHKRA